MTKMRALTYFLRGAALVLPVAACAALDALSGDLILNEDWFPFYDGSVWKYDVKKGGEVIGEAQIILTSVTSERGKTGSGTLTFIIPGKGRWSTEIRMTADAIQIAGQQPLLKRPVKVGDSWSAGATSDLLAITGPQDAAVYVLGSQNIGYTDNGERKSAKALRVDLKGYGLNEDGTADTSKVKSPLLKRWFVKGVGMVRQDSFYAPLDGAVLELTSYATGVPSPVPPLPTPSPTPTATTSANATESPSATESATATGSESTP